MQAPGWFSCLFNLLGKFRDHPLAVASALALMHAQNRPTTPLEDGRYVCCKVLLSTAQATTLVQHLVSPNSAGGVSKCTCAVHSSFICAAFSYQLSAFRSPLWSRLYGKHPRHPLHTIKLKTVNYELIFPNHSRQRCADLGGRDDDMDSRLGHGLHLVGRRALPAADDGSGVAHAAAGRRGLPGDEADHRLFTC